MTTQNVKTSRKRQEKSELNIYNMQRSEKGSRRETKIASKVRKMKTGIEKDGITERAEAGGAGGGGDMKGRKGMAVWIRDDEKEARKSG